MKVWKKALLLSVISLISPQVLAHSSHVETGFIEGLAHPFSGADHIITLVLAGLLFGRLASGQIKLAIPAILLLVVSYIWVHGADMVEMNASFIMGFILSSIGIIALATLVDRLVIYKLKKDKPGRA